MVHPGKVPSAHVSDMEFYQVDLIARRDSAKASKFCSWGEREMPSNYSEWVSYIMLPPPFAIYGQGTQKDGARLDILISFWPCQI